jgi:hypothetical protein
MAKKKKKSKGAYRDRGRLVIREGARFPDRCAVCNAECGGETRAFEFGREQKSNYIEVAAMQSIARGVFDLATRSRYTGPVFAEVPLCSWHRSKRLRQAVVGSLVFVLSVAYIFARYRLYGGGNGGEFDFLDMSKYTVLAVGTGFTGLVFALRTASDPTKVWFKPVRYYDRFVWVEGAGKDFLRELPEVEDYHYNTDAGDPRLSADELIRRAGDIDDD